MHKQTSLQRDVVLMTHMKLYGNHQIYMTPDMWSYLKTVVISRQPAHALLGRSEVKTHISAQAPSPM